MLAVIFVGAVGFFSYQYGKQTTKTESTAAVTIIPSPTITPTVANDNELIKQALFKKNNWTDDGSLTFTVSANDGKYAKGGVSAQGGGGYFFAVKDNGQWVIVADGNGVIECASLTKYPDYPVSFIPECYDSATSKTVKR